MIRTILSPGVELNEVDKSQYNATTIDTFRVLLPGFSSKGKISLPTTITSLNQFKADFGAPTNEAERYAFNATNILLNDGAEVVFARIPYANSVGYPCLTYSVGAPAAVTGELSVLTTTDPTISSASTIEYEETTLKPVSAYQEFNSGDSTVNQNEFSIVDISQAEYNVYAANGSKTNCLGILPVVTTAANAMALASQLSGINMFDVTSANISKINAFESISGIPQYIAATVSGGGAITPVDTPTNWLIPGNSDISSRTIQSISKNAAEFFPIISYSTNSDSSDGSAVYDKNYFSYIGVVVYQIEVDAATGCLQAVPVEAYAGSLIKSAVDIRTNASVYIENTINNTSKRIRLFANITDAQLKDSILYIKPASGIVLGNPEIADTAKKIDYTALTTSLDDILSNQSNILATTIDAVCDAGVSTIGQFLNISDVTTVSSISNSISDWVKITKHPTSVNVEGGSYTELSVTASGSGAITYQWKKNGEVLVGETSATLVIANVYPENEGEYACTVTVGGQSKTSTVATVTILANIPWLEISQQPKIDTSDVTLSGGGGWVTVPLGVANDSVKFIIAAKGSTPANITYQWYTSALNADAYTPINAETSNTLTIDPLDGNEGHYRCVVSMDGISQTSLPCTIEETEADTEWTITDNPELAADTPRTAPAVYPRVDPDVTSYEFDPDNTKITDFATSTAQWRAIVEKLKGFCQNTRKDCVFITESPRHFSIKGRNKIVDGTLSTVTVSNSITPNIRYISGINSSYGWGYAVWYKIADAYSGKLFWMPPSAYGAAVYVKTRRNFNIWDAPAGITRGGISIADTSFEPDLQARNALYSNSWNYSLTYVNQGTVLEGQKTFQTKTSAFDRINVRSLFLYLERRVFNVARNYIYEPNTAYTRNQFVDAIKPMFEAVKSAGGMYDYRIIADETLNTPDVIDNNEFKLRVGIKPTKTIEFIMIEFVALRTGSTFTELIN